MTSNTDRTEWRDVVGFEGLYQVSDAGSVRSLARVVVRSNGARQTIRGGLLKLHPDGRGYFNVFLSREGLTKHHKVHRLVAFAFHGPGAPGTEVCHNDGDPLNNRASNLRWGTRSENIDDALRGGTFPIGEAVGHAILNEGQVREIRAERARGVVLTKLADRYGVHPATIQAAASGRSWKHVV